MCSEGLQRRLRISFLCGLHSPVRVRDRVVEIMRSLQKRRVGFSSMQQAALNGGDGNIQSDGESFRRPRRPTNTWQDWPTPPQAPLHLVAANTILIQWARSRGARGRQLELLSGLLDRDYLLSLPLPPEAVGFDDHNRIENQQLRYLFRRHVATILGWTKRRVEGARYGFSISINRALREDIYLDRLWDGGPRICYTV